MANNRSDRGFTIIEMLVIVVIIGVLASISLFRMHSAPEAAIVASLKSDLRGLIVAQELHRSDHDSYASSLEELDGGVRLSEGVQVELTVSGDSWLAEASHPSVPHVCRAGRELVGPINPVCQVASATD